MICQLIDKLFSIRILCQIDIILIGICLFDSFEAVSCKGAIRSQISDALVKPHTVYCALFPSRDNSIVSPIFMLCSFDNFAPLFACHIAGCQNVIYDRKLLNKTFVLKNLSAFVSSEFCHLIICKFCDISTRKTNGAARGSIKSRKLIQQC